MTIAEEKKIRILAYWILAGLVIAMFSGCSLQAETGRAGPAHLPFRL